MRTRSPFPAAVVLAAALQPVAGATRTQPQVASPVGPGAQAPSVAPEVTPNPSLPRRFSDIPFPFASDLAWLEARAPTLGPSSLELSLSDDSQLLTKRLRFLRFSWESLMKRMDETRGNLGPGDQAEWNALFGQGAFTWTLAPRDPKSVGLYGSILRIAALARREAEKTATAGELAELGSLRAHPNNPMLAHLLRKEAEGTLKPHERSALSVYQRFPDDPIAAYRELQRTVRKG